MTTDFLADHVRRFNDGVRRGDFTDLVDTFAADGELVFVGVPVGPFRGREAVAEAYRAQPPDDELIVLDHSEREGEVVAGYAWAREPDVRAGEMRLRLEGDRIERLVVTFE
jgi:steroid delta-isomerase